MGTHAATGLRLQVVARAGFLALLLVMPLLVRADDAKDAKQPAPPPPVIIAREVKIPRVPQPPTIADFEGMQPHGVALQMLKLTDFVQGFPQDGAKPSERTEAYLGYDDKNVYLAWICFNEHNTMRAHLDRRENIFDDDYVEVLFDTFHDKRHAFVFDVNPMGVQADGLWTDGNGADYSWDSVWDSWGKASPKGYVILEAIPYKTIRFKNDAEKTWGIVLTRNIPKNGESDYWPRVTSNISSTLRQEATLRGFEGVKPARNMQFNPYSSLRGFRALDTRDPINPTFDHKILQDRTGMDAKFVFHNSLVLDATVNPDFSQLESDQPQDVINQRFEVFFPEKRPFFLENQNYFSTGQDGNFGLSRLLFTRRIGDPTAGLRLTGKVGDFELGVFSTDDRTPGLIVPNNDPNYGKRAYFNIARVAYDFGKQSSVSAMYTDREFAGDFNRVGALDVKIRMNDNWMFYGRSAVSSTLDNVNGNGYLYGSDTELVLNGQGKRFNEWLMYQDITPGFRTESGFVPRVDMRHLFNYYHFYWRPNGKKFQLWGPEGSAEAIWGHDGQLLMYNINGDIVFGWTRNTILAPVLGVESDTIRPADFAGLPSNRRFIQDIYGVVFRSQPWRQLTLDTRFFRQGSIVFVPPAGQFPVEGDESVGTFSVGVKPFDRLQIDNTWLLDRVVHNEIDRSVFNSNIIRTKWNVQFSKEFSFRFIAQYNGLLPNPQFTSLQTVKNVNYDFLLTYLLHPGTAVYLGYNTNLENVDPALCQRLGPACDPLGPGLLRTQNGYINDGRVFFIKISYLWRP